MFLEKTSFSHGETINGKINMQLKKPIMAKGVIVTLFAEKTSTTMGNNGMQKNKSRVFEFSVPIDQEREYGTNPTEYTFQIQVPGQNEINIEGKVGTALKALNALGNMMSSTKWFVEAKLDIPKGFDVSKKLQIQVI